MSIRPRPLVTVRSSSILLHLSCVCIGLSLAACDGDKPTDPDLRAILDDGDLGALVQGQAQTKGDPGGAGGAVPGTGGDTGMGGTGGFGGMVPGPVGGKGGAPPPPPKGGSGGSSSCGPSGTGGFFSTDAGMPPPKGPAAPVDGGMPSSDAAVADGGGAGGGSCFNGPLGFWEFNDCNDFRTQLNDSSFNGNTAFRSIKASCAAGFAGQGVSLPNLTDLVYVPDQPTFTFGRGVTVAAWINPRKLGGVQSLFRKRQSLTSSLALVLNGKQLQFVIDRKGALPASIEWKGIKEGTWTHVAARFDGASLALFINGKLVTEKSAPGTIADGEGPLLIANDAFFRRFDGVVDNVWFATSPAPNDVVAGLTCAPRAPTLVATPSNSGPVAAGSSFTFDLALKNNNSSSCAAESFFFFSNSFFPDISINPSFTSLTLGSGETQHIPVVVTSQSESEPGERQLSFQAQSNQRFNDGPAFANATLVVAEQTGCHVKTSRELLIKHLSVVDDPVRTVDETPGDPRNAQWTFKHLMEQMAPSPEAAPDMVEGMFKTWLTPQMVNGFTIDARPAMQDLVLQSWPRTANGKLDLAHPPLQLQAIVNRFDLRNLEENNAGEGRFVFAVLNQGFPMQFTLILEYKLPAHTLAEVQTWANDWHALGALPFPSEAYNAALADLTERFVKHGAAPGRPNGSAINAVRTNEIALSFEWQLREFDLDPTTGLLRPTSIKLTPDIGFNNTPALADWINANQTAIIAETHDVPATFNGAPFLGGAVRNDLTGWNAPGVDPEARFHFSLNTCNGCHSSQETNTGFLQISPRFPGTEAFLSGFMTGTSVFDGFSGTIRSFNDLGRRNTDLKGIVCGSDPAVAPKGVAATSRIAAPSTDKLRHGIRRVH